VDLQGNCGAKRIREWNLERSREDERKPIADRGISRHDGESPGGKSAIDPKPSIDAIARFLTKPLKRVGDGACTGRPRSAMRASGTPSRHEVETICVTVADALV
jgi:hypothetical protein